ncbi:glycerophosphoryl diester phosphodiesterase membrane domain-containing protein [Streptomyces griseoviridis]|uniref:glycerophosphoryl diester phosphodiesterase membrane domain-containing protein n=1 Tax=Streptomyces griseoviridis TaxID=45398 RepID=UPI00344BEEA0
MNDTPGWASPGSAPSDGHEPGTSEPADQQDRQPDGQGVKWSKDQPPAGQWSAPTGAQVPGQAQPPSTGPGWGGTPPTGPAGGWGAGQGGYGGPGGPGPYGGGWGSGWGGPPPAAKPGVIPLRPLGVGEILDGAVSTMRTHWRTVLGISLTVAVVTQVVVILLQGLVLDDASRTMDLDDPNASSQEVFRAMGNALLGLGAVSLIALIGTVVATALLTTVTSRAVLGKPVTTGEAWRDARPQLPKLFGLILLLLAIVFGLVLIGAVPGILVAVSGWGDAGAALIGLGCLAGAALALWLMIRFSLASPTLMLEKQGIGTSMRRSAKLVRGSWWRVFGIQLLATIIANLVSSLVVLPFSVIGALAADGGFVGLLDESSGLGWTFLIVSGIGSVIGSMITFPITAGVTVLLYVDQRIRREGLDLELARAAGVQGYGAEAGAGG